MKGLNCLLFVAVLLCVTEDKSLLCCAANRLEFGNVPKSYPPGNSAPVVCSILPFSVYFQYKGQFPELFPFIGSCFFTSFSGWWKTFCRVRVTWVWVCVMSSHCSCVCSVCVCSHWKLSQQGDCVVHTRVLDPAMLLCGRCVESTVHAHSVNSGIVIIFCMHCACHAGELTDEITVCFLSPA